MTFADSEHLDRMDIPFEIHRQLRHHQYICLKQSFIDGCKAGTSESVVRHSNYSNELPYLLKNAIIQIDNKRNTSLRLRFADRAAPGSLFAHP